MKNYLSNSYMNNELKKFEDAKTNFKVSASKTAMYKVLENSEKLMHELKNEFVDLDTVLDYYNKGIVIKYVDKQGNNYLHAFMKANHKEKDLGKIGEFLKKLGMDPNAKNNNGLSAFHYACKDSSIAKLELLLAMCGENTPSGLFEKDNDGLYPMDYCKSLLAKLYMLNIISKINIRDKQTRLNYASMIDEMMSNIK